MSVMHLLVIAGLAAWVLLTIQLLRIAGAALRLIRSFAEFRGDGR